MCLLLGEMFGLKTLHQLLRSYGIKRSKGHQLWAHLSTRAIVGIMNQWLWAIFTPEFERLLGRSGSTHSRENLTLVIDGSIFRKWMPQECLGQYFGKFFSGQINATAYGLGVVLAGISIGEVFYPLHFQLRPKGQTEAKVSERILEQVCHKLSRIAEPSQWPPLYLSVDSGFRSKELLTLSQGYGIHYIGVPTKKHVLYWEGQKYKFEDLIPLFEAKEAAAKAKAAPGDPPFTWRLRVYYRCMEREVVLLLFRLKGSNKVSIIFSDSLEIKAKTLRRHWFARTKIERLFRILKHELNIQQATTTHRLAFLKHFAFGLVKALHAQLWTQTLQKAHPNLRRIGYLGAQNLISFHQIERQELDRRIEELWHTPFAT